MPPSASRPRVLTSAAQAHVHGDHRVRRQKAARAGSPWLDELVMVGRANMVGSPVRATRCERLTVRDCRRSPRLALLAERSCYPPPGTLGATEGSRWR